MHIIFETSRLLLRQFTAEDAPLIFLLNSNPLVIQYVHEPVLETKAAARQVLLDIILPQYERNLGRWATHTKNNNQFIGWCGLKYLSETGAIDLGYRFLPEAWGKGYATEAATGTLLYGLNKLGLKKITAMAHAQNTASLNVLQKIGMQYVGDETEYDYTVKTFVATSSTQPELQ